MPTETSKPVIDQPKKRFQRKSKNKVSTTPDNVKDVEITETTTKAESASIQQKKQNEKEISPPPVAAVDETGHSKATLETLLGEVTKVVISQNADKFRTTKTLLGSPKAKYSDSTSFINLLNNHPPLSQILFSYWPIHRQHWPLIGPNLMVPKMT